MKPRKRARCRTVILSDCFVKRKNQIKGAAAAPGKPRNPTVAFHGDLLLICNLEVAHEHGSH